MTAMLQVHSQALAGQTDVYHLFLSKFSKDDKTVYGFVEGQTDPSFYRTFAEALLPNDWRVTMRFVKGKANVLKLYNDFDWQRFPRERVAFFIDRDLSEILEETLPDAKNLYITDDYSIENSIVCRETCERVLQEIYNLHQVEENEFENILLAFDVQLDAFLKYMIPVMSYICLWRKRGEKVNLNNLNLNKIFVFSCGKVEIKAEFQSRSKLVEFIYRTCNINNKSRSGVRNMEEIFRNGDIYRRFTRGKYLMWFFAKFCENIYQNSLILCPSLQTEPVRKLSLNEANALLVIGQRARMPSSLRAFLLGTYVHYVDSRSSAA